MARHDRRVAEESGDRFAVERRRHDDYAEVVAEQGPRAQREREGEVSVETSLVELVEHEDADAVEGWVALEPARQHALGDHLDARAAANARSPRMR